MSGAVVRRRHVHRGSGEQGEEKRHRPGGRRQDGGGREEEEGGKEEGEKEEEEEEEQEEGGARASARGLQMLVTRRFSIDLTGCEHHGVACTNFLSRFYFVAKGGIFGAALFGPTSDVVPYLLCRQKA